MGHPEQWLRAALESAVPCKVWPVQASEEAVPPFLVYARTGTHRERSTYGAIESPVATFAVAIYDDSYLSGKDLAAEVRAGLDNFKGDAYGVTIEHVFLTDESDGDPVDFAGEGKPTYSVQLVFEIRYTEGASDGN